MDPNQPASSSAPATEFDLMASELTKQVCCIKYSLMACNAFGIMLGIFVVLFGISYPEENFPGGYKGKETAGISGFFIIFTLIGYYGAHRQKVYFLVPYSIIIFLFLGGNLIMWGVKPEDSVLDPDSNAVLILGGVFIILMIFALWLAWQERKKNLSGNVLVTSTAGTVNSALTAAVAANAGINSNVNGYAMSQYQAAAANQFSAQFASLPLATQQQALALQRTLQSQPIGLCGNSPNHQMNIGPSIGPLGPSAAAAGGGHRSSPNPGIISMNHLSTSPYSHYSSNIGDPTRGASGEGRNTGSNSISNRSRHGSNSSIHHSLSPSSHIQIGQSNLQGSSGQSNAGTGAAGNASVNAPGDGRSGTTSQYTSGSGHNRYTTSTSSSEHARLIKNNHLNVLYQPSSNSYITIPVSRYNSERMLMY